MTGHRSGSAGGRGVLVAGLALLALAAVALALTLAPRHPTRTPAAPAAVNPAPSPVLTTPGPSAPAPAAPPPSAAEFAAAQQTARTFLASYLPVLYGRAPAGSVRAANGHVRASLRAANRPARAPADRRPRVTALTARATGPARVLMVATIADGVSAPYRIVFAVTRQPGGWRVSELANY